MAVLDESAPEVEPSEVEGFEGCPQLFSLVRQLSSCEQAVREPREPDVHLYGFREPDLLFVQEICAEQLIHDCFLDFAITGNLVNGPSKLKCAPEVLR